MVEYENLINLQLMIFVLTGVGYILRKLNIISADSRAGLTNLVIDVVLPCNIIYSFMIKLTHKVIMAGLEILVISIIIQIMCYFLGYVLYKKTSPEQEKVLKYGTICSNAGFFISCSFVSWQN